MKTRIVIAVGVAALVTIIAVGFHPKQTKVMPLPITSGYHKNPNSLSSIGPIGPPRAVEETRGENYEAELKKAIHDSMKTKAADQDESGDW